MEQIEERVRKAEDLGRAVVEYLEMYKGDKMYNEIALAIEFGYQLCLENENN
jgi:hypothetical protein